MTADLKDVMAYLIKHYPSELKDELSNARLTKMVYLADWHQAINHGQQITNINWYFDNYGPFVRDIENTASEHADTFSSRTGSNMFGARKQTYSLKNREYEPTLDSGAKKSLDHIIKVTKKLLWADFIKLVYATHPVLSSERYVRLDLVEKAKEYNDMETVQ